MSDTTSSTGGAGKALADAGGITQDLRMFWGLTQRSWQAKEFESLGRWRKESSNMSADAFLKGKVVSSPALGPYLKACPPLAEEFLLDWDGGSEVPEYVITSHRLWVRDAKRKHHVQIRLADLAEYESGRVPGTIEKGVNP